MVNLPLYDFDEAHRAETAKKMREYKIYIAPITGSPFDRLYTDLKIPLKENYLLNLYYHLERPPLIYWLMIISSYVFGINEFGFRFPSLIFGLGTIILYLYYVKKNLKLTLVPTVLGLLLLLTSSDLWLSSQYAQLDAGLTFFLFLSLLSLLAFSQSKKQILLFLSGISFALAILSKGQPAVILIFPIIGLLIFKKLTLIDLLKFAAYSALIIVPWLSSLIIKFGFDHFIKSFVGFAVTSSTIEYLHIKAPIFWYIRWWWESLRPGWNLFLAFVAYDFLKRTFSWQKGILLFYIFSGLIFFSLSVNKIWWYVLPLLPPMALYIYLSSYDYLKKSPNRISNISLGIILCSLPIFLGTTNKIALIYGFTILSLFITILFLKFEQFRYLKFPPNILVGILSLSVALSLIFFLLRFPKIPIFYWEVKPISLYYNNLPDKKCLWSTDMPVESLLFYSNAGEIHTFSSESNHIGGCTNYLITPTQMPNLYLVYTLGRLYLYNVTP